MMLTREQIIADAYLDEMEKISMEKRALYPILIPAGVGAYYGAKKGERTNEGASGLMLGAGGAGIGAMVGELLTWAALPKSTKSFGSLKWAIPAMVAGGSLGAVAGYKKMTEGVGVKKRRSPKRRIE